MSKKTKPAHKPSRELLRQLSRDIDVVAARICTAEDACKTASDPSLSGGRSQAIAELTAVWLRREIESLDEIVEQINGILETAKGGAV